MNGSMIAFLIIIVSYFLGTITGAYYVVKFLSKLDIRYMGSGNVGATNAGRALGKKGFLITLAVDAGKVWMALSFASFISNGKDLYLILSALFLLIGHLFPIQLRFHGGKGVVVYLASALFLEPISIAVFGIIMGAAYIILRKYTAAGFISMASIPISVWLMDHSFMKPAGLLLLFIIVLFSHTKFFSRQVHSIGGKP
ncbi:glycerol-3-phosphate acyltransferase [Cytobacillus oceanisediminis]|uniref:glycerol-3-phosphate acyltransferase n=1 Tax=Cytobacillus oceanisediminis TaxID=665099 RepID=UPI0037368E10